MSDHGHFLEQTCSCIWVEDGDPSQNSTLAKCKRSVQAYILFFITALFVYSIKSLLPQARRESEVRLSISYYKISLVILANIFPIFTFCSGQFIASFIYLSKMLYAMLSIGVKVKVKEVNKVVIEFDN